MSTTGFFLVIFLLVSHILCSQQINPIADLGSAIQESSGLIFIDERIVTHNDSGGGAVLFEVNEFSGEITRQVAISNASNKDWEDIDIDESHIYLGDIGNNNGSRTDLRIYKISLLDYLDEDNQATAEVIEFSYEDQTNFTSSSMSTNFDAEALIAYRESLYIFTKNWIDNKTQVYRIPKNPGVHVAQKIDEFDSKGLVTGAAYSPVSDRIMLVGYAGISPFLIELSGFSNGKFSNGQVIRSDLDIPSGTSVQIEAVAFDGIDRLLISSEANVSGDASLMSIPLSTLSGERFELNGILIYPNPVQGKLWVKAQTQLHRIEIFDYSGRLILKKDVNSESISLEELPIGNYVIRLYNNSGVTIRKLIRQ